MIESSGGREGGGGRDVEKDLVIFLGDFFLGVFQHENHGFHVANPG